MWSWSDCQGTNWVAQLQIWHSQKGESLRDGSPVILSGSSVNVQRIHRDLSSMSQLAVQTTVSPFNLLQLSSQLSPPTQPNQGKFGGVNNTVFIINNSSSTFILEFFFFLPLLFSSFCKFFLQGTWVTHRSFSSSCSRVLKDNRECVAQRCSWDQLHGDTTQSSCEQPPNLWWLMEKSYSDFSSLTWFRSLAQPNEEQMVPLRLQKHFSWNFGWIMQIGF